MEYVKILDVFNSRREKQSLQFNKTCSTEAVCSVLFSEELLIRVPVFSEMEMDFKKKKVYR